jgi:AcrR family transcriptional regulator
MAVRGRPREFDLDDALEHAVEVFWLRGYDGASLSALTAAMGINRPSLYAAYGDKADLLAKAVARYAERDMAYVRAALDQLTAREVIRTLLLGQAQALTRPDRPAGCLSLQGGLASSAEGAHATALLAASRLAGEAALAERLSRAVDEGDLPAGTDPVVLARFLSVVQEGQAVHAAAGVGRAELEQSAELALRVVDLGPARARVHEAAGA